MISTCGGTCGRKIFPAAKGLFEATFVPSVPTETARRTLFLLSFSPALLVHAGTARKAEAILVARSDGEKLFGEIFTGFAFLAGI